MVKIPNPLERRHLIERELPPDQALALAEAYAAEDRIAEAVVFFGKAGAEERLRALLAEAIEAGDVFLVQAITRETQEAVPSTTWERIAEHANAAGKELYAEAALRQANRGDD